MSDLIKGKLLGLVIGVKFNGPIEADANVGGVAGISTPKPYRGSCTATLIVMGLPFPYDDELSIRHGVR